MPKIFFNKNFGSDLDYLSLYNLFSEISLKFRSNSPSRTRTYDSAVNSRVLYRLSYGGVLALPIFPGRRQPSIVGRNELNYRVRNGNGWTLVLINTNYAIIKEKEW